VRLLLQLGAKPDATGLFLWPSFSLLLSLSLALSLSRALALALAGALAPARLLSFSLSLSSLCLITSLSLSLSHTHIHIHILKRRGSTDEFGRTAIMLAVSRRDKQMTEILLRAGANVEGISRSLCTSGITGSLCGSLCVCAKVAGFIISTSTPPFLPLNFYPSISTHHFLPITYLCILTMS